ncbi:hypothetical protein Poli38472_001381 [Pythium oligandrum]|uniref:Uncharacterized protein n=1 Tax=Pythium oligandrum TaxID=41045 RepID=A0A8K1FMC7_PYTOL|nr:hypothetical protein Poli38472_001381 [Pythium oligandrum]|eukprot:TMW69225.1 hypothetical protein Poli38472_001381 [Pythium oligandrum]
MSRLHSRHQPPVHPSRHQQDPDAHQRQRQPHRTVHHVPREPKRQEQEAADRSVERLYAFAAGNKGDPPIPAEMTINVPENPEVRGKDHCVLEFYWEVTHLDPHELFDNCADVKIGGGGSSGSTTTTTAPAPAATTTPATGGGSYVYSGPARTDSASMKTLCNQNCPSFCPTDIWRKSVQLTTREHSVRVSQSNEHIPLIWHFSVELV